MPNHSFKKIEAPIPSIKNIFYGWKIVLIAIVIGFLTTGLSGYAFGILLPQLSDALADGSRGQISIGFSLASLVSALISPLIGRYADKYSPKQFLMIGACLIALAYWATSTATSLWQFYVYFGLLFGPGICAAGPLVRSVIVARWFEHQRGRALGISVLGVSIAGLVLPIVLNELINGLGWRISLIIFGIVVSGVLLPAIFFFIKNDPAEIDEVRDGHAVQRSHDHLSIISEETDEKVWTWRELIRSKAFWATGLTFGPMMCVYLVVMIHLFGHAQTSGLSDEQAAFVLTMVALGSLIGKPIVGYMADVIGTRTTLWISLALQAAAMLIFSAAASLWVFLLAATLQGLGYSALSSMRTYVLSTNLGTRSLGTTLGALRYLELPFAISASPLAGFIYDSTGNYDTAFLIFTGMLMLGLFGPFFIHDAKATGPKAN